MFLSGLCGRPKFIQFWLTWLVIACILPAAGGATFLLVQSYDQERSNLEATRIGMARALVQVVDGELSGAGTVLQVLALSPLLASGDFSSFHQMATWAVAKTSGTNIVLQKLDGSQIVNTLKPFGTPLPAHDVVEPQRPVSKAAKVVVSDVFIGAVAGHPLIRVAVPVMIEGKVKYILSMGFFSENLGKMLMRQNMPAGWIAAIYDRKGIIAARTQAASLFVGKPGAGEAVRYVARFPEGSLATHSLEGDPIYSTFSRSAFSGWTVIVGVPLALASGALKHSLLLNTAGAVTALVLGAALAQLIGERISTSITALAIPALTLGSGGPVVLPPSNIIEVDALRTVLQKAAHLIEQRVQERDAAKDAEHAMAISAEAAGQANRAKSEFLASMSHELRTPLHGILGYAEMMRLDGGLTPAQAKHLEVMLGAGEHLLAMINAVLDLSQIEADQLELHPTVIEASSLARTCLDVVRPAANRKGLALVLVPSGPLCLAADATRLRQVLVNLLGNAVKFTPAGSIEVRLRQVASGAFIRLEVVDTGPGIPAEQRTKLFQSFERLGFDPLRAIEGAGLGLALSSRLMSLMDGRLGHEDNPNGGSIFWLELPLGNVEASLPDMVTASPADDQVQRRTLHVLVVDDVAMNRDIASSFLRAAGHRVTCAESGEQAIAAVTDTKFDVLLMDVRMPEMDGLEATRRIRSLQGEHGQVPIVALTAQAFTEQVAECHRAGMDDHLGKPFDQDMLLAIVMRAAEARRSSAESLGLGSTPASGPEGVAKPLAGSELPVLDAKAFTLTASCLEPAAVDSYLRTIIELAESLRRNLRATNALISTGDALAEAAHTLAGTAGMFGFHRLSAMGRSFERAVQSGAPEAPDLADGLCAAIDATLQEMRVRVTSAYQLMA